MAAPPGALQQAVLVAVPLALVVLIFVTPSLLGREQPATAIPVLRVQVTDNETALFYVQRALTVALYEYVNITVTGLGSPESAWSENVTKIPSLFLRVPVRDGWSGNVTALAREGDTTFRYNGTVGFVWDKAGWILRVQPEGATAPRDFREAYTVAMMREAAP